MTAAKAIIDDSVKSPGRHQALPSSVLVRATPLIDDSVFFRVYDYDHYNCFHFACEMIGRINGGAVPEPEAILAAIRGGLGVRSGGFKRVRKPGEGSLCLFQNPSSEETHTGVFYQGRVLHIQENGVKFQPLHIVLLQFRKVSFYDYLETL